MPLVTRCLALIAAFFALGSLSQPAQAKAASVDAQSRGARENEEANVASDVAAVVPSAEEPTVRPARKRGIQQNSANRPLAPPDIDEKKQRSAEALRMRLYADAARLEEEEAKKEAAEGRTPVRKFRKNAHHKKQANQLQVKVNEDEKKEESAGDSLRSGPAKPSKTNQATDRYDDRDAKE